MMRYEDTLREILSAQRGIIEDLEIVRELNLPDWCIAAGYVRNCVWDRLHEYEIRTPLHDVDVLIYDRENATEEHEKALEKQLKKMSPLAKWSVKNQARMHIRNNDSEYTSIEDAMMRWPETATAVGVRLDAQGNLEIVAPYGLEDLFELRLRQSPLFQDSEIFKSRIKKKRWLDLWPQLTIHR